METPQLDAVLTEFAVLATWMRNEGINRPFVGGCYCCDWRNIDDSDFACEWTVCSVSSRSHPDWERVISAMNRRSIILESCHLNDRCTFGTCRKGNSHYSAKADK